MIVLMQKLKSPDEWTDMTIPPRPGAAPTRGETPRVRDAAELADVLCEGEVHGTFRVMMRDGHMHMIVVRETIVYVAEIEQVV